MHARYNDFLERPGMYGKFAIKRGYMRIPESNISIRIVRVIV